MKVRRVTVSNFRGVRFGVVTLDGHSLLVGGNAVGKSTICEALDLALGLERLYRRPVIDEFDFHEADYRGDAQTPPSSLPQVRIEVVLTELSQKALRRFHGRLRPWSAARHDRQVATVAFGPTIGSLPTHTHTVRDRPGSCRHGVPSPRSWVNLWLRPVTALEHPHRTCGCGTAVAGHDSCVNRVSRVSLPISRSILPIGGRGVLPLAISSLGVTMSTLRWFLDGTRMAQLAVDNGISGSTGYSYLHEGIDVLASRAPNLESALLAAKMAGHTHVSIDGTLIETDRCRTPGPTKGVDLWWSGSAP